MEKKTKDLEEKNKINLKTKTNKIKMKIPTRNRDLIVADVAAAEDMAVAVEAVVEMVDPNREKSRETNHALSILEQDIHGANVVRIPIILQTTTADMTEEVADSTVVDVDSIVVAVVAIIMTITIINKLHKIHTQTFLLISPT